MSLVLREITSIRVSGFKSNSVMMQQMRKIVLKSSCTTSCFPFCGLNSFSYNNKNISRRVNIIRQDTILTLGNSLSSWNRNFQKDLTSSHRIQGFSKNLTISSKAIVDASPSSLQPYLRLMRIDRPIGVWLVFLPCAWSISLAMPGGQLPDAKMLTLFALGSFFMRGAGCVINDMWDKDFDAKVARTKDRPLASGELTRFKALCFLSMPLTISLSILLTFNWNTIFLGVCSMVPCILYPLMKRVTYWPQAFLGLTFNWGAVMGWSAVRGVLDWGVLPLYASCIAWTLVYDTIYAFQDKEDDMHIGVMSTALKFGESTKAWLTGFNSLITAGLLSTGYLTDQTWPYYLGVAMFATHLGHQIYTVNLNDPYSCGQKFRSNRNLGLMFWMMILAANILKTDDGKAKDVNEKQEPTENEILVTNMK